MQACNVKTHKHNLSGIFCHVEFLCTEKGLKLAILMYHVFFYIFLLYTEMMFNLNIRSLKTFVSSNFYFPKSLNKLTANNISLFNILCIFLFLQQHLSVFCIIFLNPFALLKFLFVQKKEIDDINFQTLCISCRIAKVKLLL